MLLLADMPTAESLEPLGYHVAIASPETLEATVAQICQRLLGHAPVTMRVTREMLAALAVDTNTDGGNGIRTCYGGRDFAEGVWAFLDERSSAWLGA